MTDYISREAAVRAIDVPNIYHGIIAPLQEILCDIPAADVVKVVHARWIKKEFLHCSECDMPTMHPWPYCQKCGAKMDGGEKDATVD